MSAPIKKRAIRIDSDTNSSSNDECSENEVNIYKGQEEIQVDFEGRNPIDSDFHGIKQLLQQLFLKAHVNLSDLTDLIISQNFVGSVVKQSETDEDSGDEEDSDINDVFGITSVVNLTDKQNLECVDQLRTLLKDLCLEHGSDQSNSLVRSLLADDTHSLGLLINERFVNIPAMIAVPLLESLSKEMKRAKEKKLPFDFSHYVIICKLYKIDEKKNKKKGKGNRSANQEPGVIWSNPEEEIIDQMADAKFEFCVKGETDSGLSGQWMEDDAPMTPYRRVLLLSAEKLDPVIEHIKDVVRK